MITPRIPEIIPISAPARVSRIKCIPRRTREVARQIPIAKSAAARGIDTVIASVAIIKDEKTWREGKDSPCFSFGGVL
jgi:hypothetical protein